MQQRNDNKVYAKALESIETLSLIHSGSTSETNWEKCCISKYPFLGISHASLFEPLPGSPPSFS